MLGRPDVVVVGGGIAGGALAASLARNGISTAVLEREERYVDRVRGEWIAPWGVAELIRLNLFDLLTAAGGNVLKRIVNYDENHEPSAALDGAIDVSKSRADAPGAMGMSHPVMCEALMAAASRAGASVLRGVKDVRVVPGTPPEVEFVHGDVRTTWKPRLVVGADGRHSAVRKQLGIVLKSDEPHHFVGGMLVGGVPDWPQEVEAVGTEGDLYYLVIPQGGDRLRLYVCYGYESQKRFAGADRVENVLDAFRLRCLPLAEQVARGNPIGPFGAVPNEDRWADDPRRAGVVLMGDAAGYNDPVTGQGLSVAFRDARALRDLLHGTDWSDEALERYAIERAERMRRLLINARLVSKLRVEFGDSARKRRARALQRVHARQIPTPLATTLVGPDLMPPEAYDPKNIAALLAPD